MEKFVPNQLPDKLKKILETHVGKQAIDRRDIFGDSFTCPKCGIKFEGVVGFVCGDEKCPTFMKITC